MKNTVALLVSALLVANIAPSLFGQGASEKYGELLPQNLLRLVHAPEVHEELKFSAAQVASLESFFEQSDGLWFRSRILPAEKQRSIMASLEANLRTWLSRNASEQQRMRLQEIEYRSLGIRMLLRPDLAKKIGLDEVQQSQFAELAKNSNQAMADFQKASAAGEVSEEVKQAVVNATQAEQSNGT